MKVVQVYCHSALLHARRVVRIEDLDSELETVLHLLILSVVHSIRIIAKRTPVVMCLRRYYFLC